MDFDSEWARCAPWLEAALSHCGDTHDLADVKAEVSAREARFWAGQRAALVTKRTDYPRFSALTIWLGGGDLDEIRTVLVPAVEVYARETGAAKVLIAGRPGWSRALGYAPKFHICEKEL